jgi:hypothetical protein
MQRDRYHRTSAQQKSDADRPRTAIQFLTKLKAPTAARDDATASENKQYRLLLCFLLVLLLLSVCV